VSGPISPFDDAVIIPETRTEDSVAVVAGATLQDQPYNPTGPLGSHCVASDYQRRLHIRLKKQRRITVAVKQLATEEAPNVDHLPLSQGIEVDGFVFVSGMGPIDPDTGDVVGETARQQTERTLDNVERILEEAGLGMDDLVNVTVYLRDIDDYESVNEVYERYVSEPYPARAVVQVVRSPQDHKIEVQAIAKQ
jgi:2-iminobutanoate/2-iminopropanoate deaminase